MDAKEFGQIMDMAIAAEIEAFEFYTEVAAAVTDANMKRVFSELAEEESGHKVSLERIKNKELQNFSFPAVTDYGISDTVETPPLSMKMKPADAIALAMKKEEEAMKMYTGLANAASDAEQKNVFTSLARMEAGHKAKMEDLYNQTAFPEVW
ncbi:MAG: ferritin family protein [Syntrophomonas sp.]|nr:ferritin family protein [Syntrophomonas sp.]